jgi:malonate transporter and related proteins
MLSTVIVVLPIFALVLVGYLSRRMSVLGPHATGELNRFVVYLALPALLFDIMANTTWAALYQPGFVATFGLSCACVFALTVAIRLRRPRHLADACLDALNAAYANTGFIGIPLCLVVFGRDSLPAATVATIMTVCVLFAVAIILIEIGLQTERRTARLLLKVGRSLCRNPLLVSPVLGAAVAAAGLHIPASGETFLKQLGGAASPCALVALGLFLAEKQPSTQRQTGATALLVGLKLLLQPVIAWGLATRVFGLSPMLTNIVVLLAALPTGTGPFMLAEFYRREAGITSRVILASTVLSVLTVSGYLLLAG